MTDGERDVGVGNNDGVCVIDVNASDIINR